MRMPTPRLLLAAAVFTLLPATPAQAVAPFGATHRVTANGCATLVSATTAGGTTRGFTACTNGWRFVQGSGSSWTSSATPYGSSEDIVAVAIDGTTTWLVTVNNSGTFLRSRVGTAYNAGKRLSPRRVERGGAALLATGGRYLVVWSQDNGSGGAHLWEAHTLGGNAAPRKLYGDVNQPNTREADPVLAFQPGTRRSVVAWTHALTQSQTSVLMSYGTGGPWVAARTVARDAYQPSLAVEGNAVAVGYGRADGTGAVATGTTAGMTAVRRLTGQVQQGPRIAFTSGVLGAVWVARTTQQPYPIRVATRSAGTWSERVLGAPYPNQLQGVASVSGRLRFFADYSGGYVGVRAQ